MSFTMVTIIIAIVAFVQGVSILVHVNMKQKDDVPLRIILSSVGAVSIMCGILLLQYV